LGDVIQSYRNKQTKAFSDGENVRQFLPFSRQGYRRLEILEAATSLVDLLQLPSNRLEALKGNRLGQYSIRINEQWRICFEWPKDSIGPQNVEIVDYHR
jgi:toxin HigB-1